MNNDHDAMVKARRAWVRQLAAENRPCPSEQVLSGYAQGFFDALDVAACAVIQDITAAAGEKQ